MSNAPEESKEHAEQFEGRNRFIDKLAGKPNPEKLEKLKNKPWFIRYSETLGYIMLCLAIFILPELVNQYNGIPAPQNLSTLHVRILYTQKKEPHFYVEFPDGTRRNMEWPVTIRIRGGSLSYVWTDEQRESLPGCQATVQGTPIHFTFDDRFRVWALECPQNTFQ